MLQRRTVVRLGRMVVGVCLMIGLAGPAIAGNVYSWVSEDGTYSFTDDPKRIPAKHKGAAQVRALGDLKRYERYTVDRTGKAYRDRLQERRKDLREQAMAATPIVIPGVGSPMSGQGPGFVYNIPLSGGGHGGSGGGQRGIGMQLPLTGIGGAGVGPGASTEPLSVESMRVWPTDGQQTRHYTIVKQGDRVISVFKGENRDQSTEGVTESDLGL